MFYCYLVLHFNMQLRKSQFLAPDIKDANVWIVLKSACRCPVHVLSILATSGYINNSMIGVMTHCKARIKLKGSNQHVCNKYIS